MSDIFLGIDPGQSGGIAFVSADGRLQRANKMGGTEADTLSLLDFSDGVCGGVFRVRAMIEKVHAMPAVDWKSPPCAHCGQRRTIRGAASLGTFMENFGVLRGFLIASKIPFELETALTWQRYMHCLTKGDKNVSKARAQELFPGVKITHATADAILIAEYGRRKALGLLGTPIKITRKKKDPKQKAVAFAGMEGVDDF
jgi:hypothetical protein